MTIEFCAINKPEDWIEMVAEQFGTSVTNDGFTVPPQWATAFSSNTIRCRGSH